MGIINVLQHRQEVRQKEQDYENKKKEELNNLIEKCEQMFFVENCQLIEEQVREAIEFNRFEGFLRNKILIKAHVPYEERQIFDDYAINEYKDFEKKFHHNRAYTMKMLNKVAEAVQNNHPEWILTSKIVATDYDHGYNEGWIVRIVH